MTRKRPSAALIDAIVGGSITAEEGRFRGLRNLALQIFLDRNAQGMPQRERLKIKAAARPMFREAIRALRASRDALRAGNRSRHEHQRDVARMNFAFGRIEFFRPFAHEVGRRDKKIAERSGEAAASAAEALRKAPDLYGLIRACIERGESITPYVKEWADAFGVNASTVYRREKEVLRDIASGK